MAFLSLYAFGWLKMQFLTLFWERMVKSLLLVVVFMFWVMSLWLKVISFLLEMIGKFWLHRLRWFYSKCSLATFSWPLLISVDKSRRKTLFGFCFWVLMMLIPIWVVESLFFLPFVTMFWVVSLCANVSSCSWGF